MQATATAVRTNPNRRPSEEILAHSVQMRTDRQIRRLEVHCDGPRVRLIGESRSYYLKQLATHAILELVPHASIENAIEVENG